MQLLIQKTTYLALAKFYNIPQFSSTKIVIEYIIYKFIHTDIEQSFAEY